MAGHLLNVPAAKMSAFADQPGDFLDYLTAANAYPGEAREVLGERYVCRHYFAAYLQQRLQEAPRRSPAQLQVIAQPVLGLQPDDHGYQLTLGDGSTLHAARRRCSPPATACDRCRWLVPTHCPPMT